MGAYLDFFIIRKIILRRVHLTKHRQESIDVGRFAENRSLFLRFSGNFRSSRFWEWFLNRHWPAR